MKTKKVKVVIRATIEVNDHFDLKNAAELIENAVDEFSSYGEAEIVSLSIDDADNPDWDVWVEEMVKKKLAIQSLDKPQA